MKPKEIQEKLGINAARIKFFREKGIFAPEHPPEGNRSTNYTETDYERLRTIVVLTKSGLTCSDIRKMQNGELSLEEAAMSRQDNIQAEISRKKNSLELLSQLIDDRVELSTFNTDYYWNLIERREAEGEEFVDLEEAYAYHPVSMDRKLVCPWCQEELELDLEEFLYDQSSDEKENGMGPDIVYSFDSGDDLECEFCGKQVRVSGWIREYPMGAYDSEDIKIEKGED